MNYINKITGQVAAVWPMYPQQPVMQLAHQMAKILDTQISSSQIIIHMNKMLNSPNKDNPRTPVKQIIENVQPCTPIQLQQVKAQPVTVLFITYQKCY